MRIVYKISRMLAGILAVLVLIGWMPAAESAFAAEKFIVSPTTINKTVRVLPGEASDSIPFSIDIDVEGSDPVEFSVETFESWLTLRPTEGKSPMKITGEVTVTETMGEGTWEASIIVNSADAEPVTIPVSITVTRSFMLTVSPTSLDMVVTQLDLVVTEENAGQQIFPLTITSADPNISTYDWSAQTDAPWLTLSKNSGTSNDNIKLTVNPQDVVLNEDVDGDGILDSANGNVTFRSSLNPDPVSIPVSLTVDRGIDDLLIVSPSSLNLAVSENNAGQQTFPITISNADPNISAYDWSAQTDAPWLTLSSNSGTGNTTTSLTVTPQEVVINEDVDGDGFPDSAIGTVTFRSSLDGQQTVDPVVLTVRLTIAQSFDLSVHPGQLFWSIEKDAGSGIIPLDAQILQIFSGPAGWIASTDVNFLTIGNEAGENGAGKVSEDPYGQLSVSPVSSVVQAMAYGNHTGTITISDRYSQFFRQIPVTINIRRPGEAVSLPAPVPETYQISPYYSMIETAAASTLHLQLPVPDDLLYLPTQTMCEEAVEEAVGEWRDPDNVPGNLNEYCSLNQYVYVLMEFPQMAPGLIYAWDKLGQFFLAYDNGIKTSGADAHTYADGPVPVIPVGPVQLLEYHGTMVISTRIGADLDTAVETQRIQINIRTLEGTWNVTESYNGMLYSYDTANFLNLYRKPAEPGYYAGTWGSTPVNVLPGDGMSWLHEMSFVQNGLTFTYQIQSLSAGQMSGIWRFTWPGGASNWETFQASRQLQLPSLPLLPW